MLKLKLQYFGHLMPRVDPLQKTLMMGKIEGRRSGWQGLRWLDGITDSMDKFAQNLGGSEGRQPDMLQSTGSQRVRHN